MFKKYIVILSAFLLICGCSPKTKEELFQEGVGHFKKNNPQGAIVLFKKALEKDPNFFDARLELAGPLSLPASMSRQRKSS